MFQGSPSCAFLLNRFALHSILQLFWDYLCHYLLGNPVRKWLLYAGIISGILTGYGVPARGEMPHFEKQIAPLIAKHCLECHTQANAEGGLDLSSRLGWQKGGDSGDLTTMDAPLEGLVWQYLIDDSMPKDRPPLAKEEKELLRQWLLDGAVWDVESIDPFQFVDDRHAGYDWWSLQIPVRGSLPEAITQWLPEAQGRPENPIDLFILDGLHRNGLKPAPAVDRRTLIRRIYFDLLGLPPTPEQIEAFLNDPLPDAYVRLVDELLESPHYGERWARNWLDVVRFGETQGFERNLIRENAWRYRDWVIRAFSDDLPYDDFVRFQIAGDVIQPDNFDAMIATGYHVCGTWDQVGHLEGSASMREAARWDHLEDLVATLGQTFLGMTIHCARCHDHKFDPIAQRDYYQIASLLGGVTQEQEERSGIKVTIDNDRLNMWRAQQEQLQTKHTSLLQALTKKYDVAPAVTELDSQLQALYSLQDSTSKSSADTFVNLSPSGKGPSLRREKSQAIASQQPAKELVQSLVAAGEVSVEAWLTSTKNIQSGPARIITLSLDSGQRNFTLGQDNSAFDLRFRTTKTDANGLPSLVSPQGSVTLDQTHVAFTFSKAGQLSLFVNGKLAVQKKVAGSLSNWGPEFHLAIGDELTGQRAWQGAVHALAIYSRELSSQELADHVRVGPQSIGLKPVESSVLARATQSEIHELYELKAELETLRERIASASFNGRAHIIIPRQPAVFHVLARGDMRKPLDEVVPSGINAFSRHGLSADFGLEKDAPEGERRRKLAEWIADKRNPLTARVMVNRLWYYHFGKGIVDTPSDFGFNGGRPTHPELLDWLACEFTDPKTAVSKQDRLTPWSIKHLHRLMVLSATYQQQSRGVDQSAAEKDSDNRLLWHFNAKRLEGEAIRDAALAISGELNPAIGGPSFLDMEYKLSSNAEFTDPKTEFSPESNRRTIYRLWARSGNHPMLQAFDCPDPSVAAPLRMQTTTPLQALSLLHNATLENCASSMATRLKAECGDQPTDQVDRAFLLAFGRPPQTEERQAALDFIHRVNLEQFCLMLLNSSEFLFVN